MSNELIIEDNQTILSQPQEKQEKLDFQLQIKNLISTVGTLQITEEQTKILYASIPEEIIEIRPDGLIYLPWMEYVTRLRQAFGLEWGIIPIGLPQIKDNLVFWGFYLLIKGKLMGFAFGEQQYQPTNLQMTWGDACEGAKSNALMRLCKGLGIGLELWQPTFIRHWKEKYAEKYIDEKGKTKWRKKGMNGVEEEKEKENNNICSFGKYQGKSWEEIAKSDLQYIQWIVEKSNQSKELKEKLSTFLLHEIPQNDSDKQIKTIHILLGKLKERGYTDNQYRDYLLEKWDKKSSKELNNNQKEELIAYLSKKLNEYLHLTFAQRQINDLPEEFLNPALKSLNIKKAINELSDEECKQIKKKADEIADEKGMVRY